MSETRIDRLEARLGRTEQAGMGRVDFEGVQLRVIGNDERAVGCQRGRIVDYGGFESCSLH
jgi:hypothetical protein